MSNIGVRKSQQEWEEFYRSQISLLFHDTKRIDAAHLEVIITFLSYLFPYFGQRIGKIYETYDQNAFRRNIQIAHPEKFDRYFYNQ